MSAEPPPEELARMVAEARDLFASGMPAISVIRQIRETHDCPLIIARQVHDLARQPPPHAPVPAPRETDQEPGGSTAPEHGRTARIADNTSGRQVRLRFNRLAGAAILLGIGWWGYGFLSAEHRVPAVCARIMPGQDVTTALRIARQHGLQGRIPDDGPGLVVETRTFGRHGCALDARNGQVISSTYIFAD